MERESNPMQPQCRSGCGFYGNPAQDGLCSVCYKDYLRKKQQVSNTPVPSTPNPSFSPASITITNTAKPTVQSLQQHNDIIKEISSSKSNNSTSNLTDNLSSNVRRSNIDDTSPPNTTTSILADDINLHAEKEALTVIHEEKIFKSSNSSRTNILSDVHISYSNNDVPKQDNFDINNYNNNNNIDDADNHNDNFNNNKYNNNNNNNNNNKHNNNNNNINKNNINSTNNNVNNNLNKIVNSQDLLQTAADNNVIDDSNSIAPILSLDVQQQQEQQQPQHQQNNLENASTSNIDSPNSNTMSIGAAKRKIKASIASLRKRSSLFSKKRKLSEDSVKDNNLVSTAGPSTSINNENDDNDKEDGDKDGKKRKNRCATCRKKVGLTGFECRCGGLFCAVHRYSDKHNCTFDYREHGAQEIRRNNPVVVGEKIQKI